MCALAGIRYNPIAAVVISLDFHRITDTVYKLCTGYIAISENNFNFRYFPWLISPPSFYLYRSCWDITIRWTSSLLHSNRISVVDVSEVGKSQARPHIGKVESVSMSGSDSVSSVVQWSLFAYICVLCKIVMMMNVYGWIFWWFHLTTCTTYTAIQSVEHL